jgi:hypothetical protein
MLTEAGLLTAGYGLWRLANHRIRSNQDIWQEQETRPTADDTKPATDAANIEHAAGEACLAGL